MLLLAWLVWTLVPSASAVGPYPDLGACQVFPDPPASLSPRAASLPTEAAWNQDISKAPRDQRSSAYIAYINSHGGDSLHPDFGSPRAYGFPYSVVSAGQRKLPIHYTAYGDESDPGPFPVPARAPVEGGNRSDGAEWDLRSAARRPEGWTSADAAGLPIFPGLVRYDEAASGEIGHAIRVTFESTQDAWVHPASHCAGDTASAAAPPMGLRLRLKAGYGLGGFSGPARAIAEAMKRYGLIVADNGSNWFFSGSSDRRRDDENLNQPKRIPGSAFEVVKSAARIHRC